jgi:hemolysin III
MPSTLDRSPDAETSSIAPVLPVKPMLRGWSHVVGFVTMVVLGVVLVATADVDGWQRTWLIVYVAGTLLMLGVSAMYHRLPWSDAARARMRRLDHSTIFLAISGAYTPVMATALTGWQRATVLAVAWGGAAVGIVLQWLPVHVPRAAFTAVYVVVGWCAMLAAHALFHGLGGLGFGLLLGGGGAYTVGAVVYALKRPDPWPKVFGYHEVFHLFTIIGAGCHLAAIAFVVVPKM